MADPERPAALLRLLAPAGLPAPIETKQHRDAAGDDLVDLLGRQLGGVSHDPRPKHGLVDEAEELLCRKGGIRNVELAAASELGDIVRDRRNGRRLSDVEEALEQVGNPPCRRGNSDGRPESLVDRVDAVPVRHVRGENVKLPLCEGMCGAAPLTVPTT